VSYDFELGRIYRMPTHFGPAPGPRQRPDGGRFDNRSDPYTLTAWLKWRAAAAATARHLPPGFTPASEPSVLVEWRQRRNLPWLAGRGYNIVVVSLAATPPSGGPAGRLQAVVWESLPDAVLTGREELGVPKLWADVSELRVDLRGGEVRAEASWLGFRFLEVTLSGLEEDAPEDRHDITGPDYYQWRYFPRPGTWGDPEVSYPTTTPGAVPDRRVQRSWRGHGALRLTAGTWEDLPTQHHVVAGLAGLAPSGAVAAGLVETLGSRDLSDQRPLEAAP